MGDGRQELEAAVAVGETLCSVPMLCCGQLVFLLLQ